MRIDLRPVRFRQTDRGVWYSSVVSMRYLPAAESCLVMSHLSSRCSTCEIFNRECSNSFDQEWDDFLTRLRELQARESFVRLELSTLVTRINDCLNQLSEVNLEKSRLLRSQPNTLSGARLAELDSSNS